MKKYSAKIVLVLLFSCFKIVAQVNKLPVPTKSFLEKAKYDDQSDEKYFAKYLGIKSEHILKRFDDSKDICSKEYQFRSGIKFKKNSCSETGNEVEIIFSNYPKNEVIKFIDWFFKTDYNVWNKFKTKYQPKEDGDAGCYLEIKEFKNKILLSYYCGC